MDRQTELLEKEDPRFYAIDKFNTGLASISTSEKIDSEILDFGLPSSPGLFLSLALNCKRQVDEIDLKDCFDKHPHPQGTWPEDHKKLFDYFELMVGQIVFSFSAIEAFSNIMIPLDYKFQLNRIERTSTKEYNKDQIERNISLDKKLDLILPEILSVTSPNNGLDLWNNFETHRKLRNRLIHLKSADMKSTGPETETIWGDLLRNHKTDFVNYAHNLIGHFIKDKNGFRWFKKFPYQ